ncbi:Copper chaperone [Abeliophyllum distichum]|uniref:Copper chaperone n=1 Tax=Abeliophyllum distichum TaxID=126358 RepID=A0ABD1T266_9LAMI
MTLPEMEKPRVTEIQVRMDCNGCVQKIKKALHGINGIYDLYFDFPQQKITIIGWADPAKIAKAIKKTRKTAIICSHSESSDDQPDQPSEPPPDGGAPPLPRPESTSQPVAEASPQEEAPKPENPPPEPAIQSSIPRDVEEIHVIHHHHAPDYRYRYGQLNPNPTAPGIIRVDPPQPTYVTHSYNSYKPSPYVTEYAYINRSPPTDTQYYSRPADYYCDEYSTGNNGNVTSIFSDENPNACRIV